MHSLASVSISLPGGHRQLSPGHCSKQGSLGLLHVPEHLDGHSSIICPLTGHDAKD